MRRHWVHSPTAVLQKDKHECNDSVEETDQSGTFDSKQLKTAE